MSRELLTLRVIILLCCRKVVIHVTQPFTHTARVFSLFVAYLVATMRTLRGNTTSISQKGVHDSVLKP